MEKIRITCSKCGKKYELRTDLSGKRVKCKCGQSMVVPQVESGPHLELTAVQTDASRPIDDGDDELRLALDAEPEAPKLSELAANSPKSNDRPAPKDQNPEMDQRMKIGLIAVGGVVGALIIGVVLFLVVRSASRPGFPTPNDAVAAYQAALERKNWKNQFRTLDSESQVRLLLSMVSSIQLDSGRESSIPELLSKHDLDASTARAALQSGDVAAQASQVMAIKNKPEFYGALVAAILEDEEQRMPTNPLLRTLTKKPAGKLRRALAKAEFKHAPSEGDLVHANLSVSEEQEAPIDLKRMEGRWFVHIAEPRKFAISPVGQSFVASGFVHLPPGF